MFFNAYPAWSVSIMVRDLVVIYALCSNADEFE
jgi:hypothetical protein